MDLFLFRKLSVYLKDEYKSSARKTVFPYVAYTQRYKEAGGRTIQNQKYRKIVTRRCIHGYVESVAGLPQI
ncbi:hypothetical protein AN2V17_13050 [Vallitalea sp. AN17-2]|uniref:Uncharacterized protein n=1 Tax=Vallitalea maricola TaxID=3074433 RepID=A0ACB5UGJ2_9FIRM|nr:hypothetical protein AN2V17_13050 [Vallitalea sp. AN17-2]